MSFCSFTQAPLQQLNPAPHGGEQVPPPVLELALLELEALLPPVLPVLALVEPEVPPPDELPAAIPPVPLEAVLVAPPVPLVVPAAPVPPNIRSGTPHPRDVAAATATKTRRLRMGRSYGAPCREGKPARARPPRSGRRSGRG
jgi:hypothetical protein